MFQSDSPRTARQCTDGASSFPLYLFISSSSSTEAGGVAVEEEEVEEEGVCYPPPKAVHQNLRCHMDKMLIAEQVP